MKLKAYAVFDQKAECYMTPFFLRSDGEAIRGFSDAIANTETPFGKHPHDYTLFWIGEYSDVTGQFETEAPKLLGNGVEYISHNPNAGNSQNEINYEAPVLRGPPS